MHEEVHWQKESGVCVRESIGERDGGVEVRGEGGVGVSSPLERGVVV